MTKNIRVPYGKSVHNSDEIKAVVKTLKTSTQMGKNVRTFENKIALLFNKKYGLMVNSGSSALMLAMEVLKFPKGSEIITPALTFSTTVSYIIRNKLIPVFLDVKKNTYCLDIDKIGKAITKKTKAVVIPHLIGNLVNLKKIYKFLKKKNIIIIEDSSDTLGATLNGEKIGKYSDISITSFYGSHIINCAGNGGIVCFNNRKQYIEAKLLRSWGRSSSLFDENSEKIENRFNIKLKGIRYDKKFVFEKIGHNLEPSEIGAAFGLEQLKKLNSNLKIRQKNFSKHLDFFKKYTDFFDLPEQLKNSKTGWLAFPFTVKETAPFNRTELQIFLEKKNIQTRVVFTGNIIKQPGFANVKMKTSIYGYPEADYVMKNGILIACHQGLNNKMMRHIHYSIENFLNIYN